MSSLIGRAFSVFRQKMDGPIPSTMDIKVLIPAPPTFNYNTKKMYAPWKDKHKIFP